MLDGGLEIPYNEKRFVGYEVEKKELDTEVLEKYIFNGHVGEYMEEMEEESPDKFDAHFAAYHSAELTYDNMEDTFKEVCLGQVLAPASLDAHEHVFFAVHAIVCLFSCLVPFISLTEHPK